LIIYEDLTDIRQVVIMLNDAFTQAFFICIWKKFGEKETFE